MNKITMVSLVAIAIIFGGCNEKPEEVITETATKVVEVTKEAKDSVAQTTTKAVDAVKEAKESINEVAKKAVEATKETVADVADTVTKTSANEAGIALYAKCTGCHGIDGKTKALGKSEVISGQTKEDLIVKMNEYKAGTRNVSGMGSLMKAQMATLSDADLEAIALYLSTLK